MRNLWVFLWLILMVLQLITYWLGSRWATGDQEVAPGLLALAQETNRVWEDYLPQQAIPENTSADEGIFERESLLMELRRMEESLKGSGADVDLTADLEKWFSISEHSLNQIEYIHYLRGVRWWMKSVFSGDQGCRIGRICLYPDGVSQFPCLVVELTGSPSSMGRCLKRANGSTRGWRLVELDLNKTATGESWWMLGSCRYVDENPL